MFYQEATGVEAVDVAIGFDDAYFLDFDLDSYYSTSPHENHGNRDGGLSIRPVCN